MEQDYQTTQMNGLQNNYATNNMGGNEQMPPKPDTHLALAIFTTLCCCLPFGIVGIVKASSVNSLYIMGNYEAALLAAEEAKKWSMYGIIAGAAICLIYFIIYVFSLVTALYS